MNIVNPQRIALLKGIKTTERLDDVIRCDFDGTECAIVGLECSSEAEESRAGWKTDSKNCLKIVAIPMLLDSLLESRCRDEGREDCTSCS